jgi:23S rRNA (uracil1939-C5)-methyltransferase
VVHVRPRGRQKGAWLGERVAVVTPAADAATPRCDRFGLCGGCTLQDLGPDAQRRARHEAALRAIFGPAADDDAAPAARVHPPVEASAPYGYRNKVELSFGVRRYVPAEALADDAGALQPTLGFHAPGRFDKLIDTPRCELVHDDMNALIAAVRAVALAPGAPACWDARAAKDATDRGFWRHLRVRRGEATGELLVALFTTSNGPEQAVEAVADALLATPLAAHQLVGVVWAVNDDVADVARGVARRTWGRDHLVEQLGGRGFEIGVESFFQTTTAGAEALYAVVAEAAGAGGALLDLYCGAGAIGLYLADRHPMILGVEEVVEAVEAARANAARHGVEHARFVQGRVEDALHLLGEVPGPRRIVVDPPRVGLHPSVAAALADADADVLVYVACKPASLGRDAEVLRGGGWEMTDVWTVDLFPQTGHIEAVARFVRQARP